MTRNTAANLPAQLTTFVGREREIAEIRKLICASRLVTLTGAGGAGKTRLALQAASSMSCDFDDGIWFVELAALSEPGVLPALVAQVLGVPSQPDQSPLAALLAYVGPRRMLLALDNCEHLVGACAELGEVLLKTAPRLSMLTTSREPLALPGETLYRVPPLSLPPLTLREAGSYDAIKLFVERARAVSPGFALTPDNTEAVVTICRRLDGIPLAIELASARAGVLSVQQIATHLDDRLAFLVSAHRTTPVPRHRTLRGAIDWSYELLTPAEQAVLRRLAVFAGGFTLETAQGICGDEDLASRCALDLIASLVNKSWSSPRRSASPKRAIACWNPSASTRSRS